MCPMVRASIWAKPTMIHMAKVREVEKKFELVRKPRVKMVKMTEKRKTATNTPKLPESIRRLMSNFAEPAGSLLTTPS
jgi:hypothetical protein